MPPAVNTFFEQRLERLLDLAHRIDAAFSAAGLEYRVIGGLASYLSVEEAAPDAGRLTRDVAILVRRSDLNRITEAVAPFGFEFRHAAGLDMLVQTDNPSVRGAVHLVFTGEKVRPDYREPAPEMGPARTLQGVRVARLIDLVRMKLTSFRLKDQMHLKDLEEAGLLTPEIDEQLSAELRQRLDEVRARE